MKPQFHGTSVLRFSLLSALLFIGSAHAGVVLLNKGEKSVPASDLLYQGAALDVDEAAALARRGIALEDLDPAPNDLWGTGAAEKPEPIVLDSLSLHFESLLRGNTGLFRARVTEKGRAFQLSMGLGAHAAVARARLLQRLGYNVGTPTHFARLNVRFKDLKERDDFLAALSDQTLTARKRWLEQTPERPELELHDVVLEPAQVTVQRVHWGAIPRVFLNGRRALRALIVPLVLLDVPESINIFAWEFGKTVSDRVFLNHAYAENFAEATYEDARWIALKIAKLSRQDFEECLAGAGYPEDVAALLVEKILARRNHLAELFGISGRIAYDLKLNHGAVVKGKLTRENYEHHAERFTYGDPESPLNKWELGRLVVLKGISGALRALTGQVNKQLVFASSDEVAATHQKEIEEKVTQQLRDHPNDPVQFPVSSWGGPVAGFGLTADRDVITGTYFGSDSRIQLVDTIGFSAQVGWFSGVDGFPALSPVALANVSVQRNYIHVRPLADMKTALKASWSSFYVPSFMSKLGDVLGDGLENDAKSGEFKGFLDQLAEGEIFMVTDTLVAGAHAAVKLPIGPLAALAMVGPIPALGADSSVQATVMRRTTFVRTAKGIQVYVQAAESALWDVGLDVNWWISFVRVSHERKWSQARGQAFNFDFPRPAEGNDGERLAQALSVLLKTNETELLEDGFDHFKIKHELEAQANRAKLLWMRWFSIAEDHLLKIRPVLSSGEEGAEKTLFSSKISGVAGKALPAFFSEFFARIFGLNAPAKRDSNPADSFLGRAQWDTVGVEADLSPVAEFAPIASIDKHWSGWLLQKGKMMSIFDDIEDWAKPFNGGRGLMRRDDFASTKWIEMYDITARLIIYPSGLQSLEKNLVAPGVRQVFKRMVEIEGRTKFRAWCEMKHRDPDAADETSGSFAYFEREGEGSVILPCVQPWMREVLKDRRLLVPGAKTDQRERVRAYSRLLNTLEIKGGLGLIAKILDRKDWFYQARVQGYRRGDENGDTAYLSDLLGEPRPGATVSYFQELSDRYHLMGHEVNARYLSEGY
ncbi:hypothetical protein WDW86_21255 [Bdellovibrionota bacterium FG-2]